MESSNSPSNTTSPAASPIKTKKLGKKRHSSKFGAYLKILVEGKKKVTLKQRDCRGSGRWKLAVFSEEVHLPTPSSTPAARQADESLVKTKSDSTRSRILDVAKTCLVFANMDSDQRSQLADIMWRVDLKQGESMCHAGQAGDTFFIVDTV